MRHATAVIMSAIDHDLLQRVVCPETREKLHEGSAALVAELNRRIAAQTLLNRAGRAVQRPLDAVLVRADKKVGYPVRDKIMMLFLDEAISLEGLNA